MNRHILSLRSGRSFSYRFIALFVVLLLVHAAAHAAPLASVSALTGPLSRQAGGAFQAIGLRASLNAGDLVRTGANGKATLLFLDGSQVRMNANTTVEITAPEKAGRGHTSLIRAVSGEVLARLRPGRAVQSRSAIAGVRGTVFDMVVADDGTSTLSVLEGEVDFFNPLGAVSVSELQQSVARPGQAPTQPITIANPGLIIEWTLDLERAAVPREMFFVTANRAVARQQAAAANANNPLAAGDLWFDAGELTRAADLFNAALQAPDADEAALRARLGFVALERGDLATAETEFTRALAVPNASAQARALSNVGVAWTEIARGRPGLAAEAAQRAVELDNQSARAHIARGVALMRMPGRGEDALQAFDAALALPDQPGAYQARSWRALQLLSLDRRDDAIREARQAAQQAPFSALAQGNLALVSMFTGDSPAAVRAAKAATKLNPDSVAARVALAQSLLAQGDVDQAQTEAARAVALDPDLIQARYLLGVTDAGRRDYRHAARELQAALRLEPDFLPAAAALARVETARGRKDEAVRLLTQLQERRGKSASTLAALGETLMQQTRYKEAEAVYREAVKLNPNSAQAWAELARVLDYTNRLNEAIIAAQRAVQLAPHVAEYHAWLGQIYLYSGLIGQAQREFRLALALDPRNAIALGELGTNDPDPRIIFNSVPQAVLYDPGVTRWFLRSGVNVEADAIVSNLSSLQSIQAHFEGMDGQLRYAGVAGRARDNDPDQINDTNERWETQNYLAYSPDPRTTILASGFAGNTRAGLPGPDNNGLGVNADDAYAQRFIHSQLSMRRRFGRGHSLWLSGSYEPLHLIKSDPDQITNPFTFSIPPGSLGPGVPSKLILDYLRQEVVSHSFTPEVRADFTLGAHSRQPAILTFGLARQRLQGRSLLDLALPGVDIIRGADDASFDVGYLQLTQRVNERLSYVAQMRAQREHFISALTVQGQTTREERTGWFGLPSFLVNYHLNRKTTLRLLNSTRRDEPATATLSPIETLLASEPEATFRGDPNNERTTELDVERYLGEGEFLKLFAFHSKARNLEVGGGSLPVLNPPSFVLSRARSTGVGLRYERRLTPRLFANSTFVTRRTRGAADGEIFDGDTIPYHPRNAATLGLDYVHPKGNKIHFNLRREGRFFADDPFGAPGARPGFNPGWQADLSFEIEPSVRYRFLFGVSNIFDREQILFANYPDRGRTVFAGVTLRR